MIELVKLDETIKLDIRYARQDNFVGRPVYGMARAFLQTPAAESLVRVHRKLKMEGCGLLIFDAYRPWSVTKLFWECVSLEQRQYVADPAVGSRHNRGCAVDLGLYSLADGLPLGMPSNFDDFNQTSHPDYDGGTIEKRANRDLLRAAMESGGFTVNPKEWWHYDHHDWEEFPIMDVSFEELSGEKW